MMQNFNVPSRMLRWWLSAGCGGALLFVGNSPIPAYDLSTEKVNYVINQSHLDTQWNWPVSTTIADYLPKTLRENFALFERFPDYKWNFEGAYRYMLIKKYYPEFYPQVKEYVAKGNWNVAGSMVEACDVNIPSPESLIRQILYGNGFFKKEFGKTSVDILLPDCFGFGYALPTIAVHCGLKGFSSQKTSLWGGAVVPFTIGMWEGPDGSAITACLKPGAYVSDFQGPDNGQINEVDHATSGTLKAAYTYCGVGDVGGGKDTNNVKVLMQRIAQNSTSSVKVVNTSSDQFFRDLTPAQLTALPRYKGEMLMKTHGTGCYTSKVNMKWYNRKNEQMANAAEGTSVVADWIGNKPYPAEFLTNAWVRFLWHQFHDDLTGTSCDAAYTFSFADEAASLADFTATTADAMASIASTIDSRVTGIPLLIFNPLSYERTDIVDTIVTFASSPSNIRVFTPAGIEVPSQIGVVTGNSARVVFLAQVPATGYAVYDVRMSTIPCQVSNELSVTTTLLENGRYRVSINASGDISSIFDKSNNRELLSSPHRIALLNNDSGTWPQWEIQYSDITAGPKSFVGGPVQAQIIENGSARVTLRIVRNASASQFVQDISLASGDAGNRVEVATTIDWKTGGALCKASFPLSVANDSATYDLGLGTIKRGTNTSNAYEVPAQQWADITAQDKSYGVSILSDVKCGWDKPSANELRLTLVHSPIQANGFDFVKHSFRYALCGHAQDWRDGGVVRQAARLNQPLVALQTTSHAGTQPSNRSFVSINSPSVVAMALKKSEDGSSIILRVRETNGMSASNVHATFAMPITSAQEFNGFEDVKNATVVQGNDLVFSMIPYQPRTFAVKIADAGAFQKVPSRVSVTPVNPTVYPGSQLALTAVTLDQFGYPLQIQPALTWSVNSGATINQAGLLSAGMNEVRCTVSVTPQGLTAIAAHIPVYVSRGLPLTCGVVQRLLSLVDNTGSPYIPFSDSTLIQSTFIGIQNPLISNKKSVSANGSTYTWNWVTKPEGLFAEQNYVANNFNAYFALSIMNDVNRRIKISTQQDDDLFIWMNGSLLKYVSGTQPSTTSPFTLSPGVNNFVFKLKQYGGGSKLSVLFADSAGNCIPELRYMADSGAPVQVAPATKRAYSLQSMVTLKSSKADLRITVNTSNLFQLEILSIAGKVCFVRTGNKPSVYSFNRSMLAAGVYLVRLKNIAANTLQVEPIVVR